MATLKALILSGDQMRGVADLARAFQLARFEVKIWHFNDLLKFGISSDRLCMDYAVVALSGGYTWESDGLPGKTLALKIQKLLKWDFSVFAHRGGLVLGTGNGFQVLLRLGLFGRDVSLLQDRDQHRDHRWVKVTPLGTRCVWLKGLGSLDLPMLHDEGRIVLASGRKLETWEKIQRLGMNCLGYFQSSQEDEKSLAGLCDSTGRIFGLIPHPELFLRWTAAPDWTTQASRAHAPGHGLSLFENAYQACVSRFA